MVAVRIHVIFFSNLDKYVPVDLPQIQYYLYQLLSSNVYSLNEQIKGLGTFKVVCSYTPILFKWYLTNVLR